MSPVAVVTGGASGIGLGVARQFVADGHDVAVLDRNGAGANWAAAEMQAEGVRVLGVEVDVADRQSVEAAFARVRAELGPVGILVTSAGVESFDPLLDITAEKWDRIIAVNLTGTFSCVQAAVPDMLAAGWGRIVTISSSSAQSGAPNMAHYAASKGGVISLTRALAVDLAATASPSIRSRPAWWTLLWRELRKPRVTSPGWTWSVRWSRSVGREPQPTSQQPAPSSAPRAAATSPARSSA